MEAGVNIILECSGDYDVMKRVLSTVDFIYFEILFKSLFDYYNM